MTKSGFALVMLLSAPAVFSAPVMAFAQQETKPGIMLTAGLETGWPFGVGPQVKLVVPMAGIVSLVGNASYDFLFHTPDVPGNTRISNFAAGLRIGVQGSVYTDFMVGRSGWYFSQTDPWDPYLKNPDLAWSYNINCGFQLDNHLDFGFGLLFAAHQYSSSSDLMVKATVSYWLVFKKAR